MSVALFIRTDRIYKSALLAIIMSVTTLILKTPTLVPSTNRPWSIRPAATTPLIDCGVAPLWICQSASGQVSNMTGSALPHARMDLLKSLLQVTTVRTVDTQQHVAIPATMVATA
jgi:energy-converting hydrogenase Eha subunit A